MPKANIKLLKRLRTRFLRMRHKQHFAMGVWGEKNECGTTACIAGHALLLSGYGLRYNEDSCEFDFYTPGGRRVEHPARAAQRQLGLSEKTVWGDGENEGLFYDFTIKTPKQAAERIDQLMRECER